MDYYNDGMASVNIKPKILMKLLFVNEERE